MRHPLIRPLGAGLAMALPLFLGLIMNDLKMASLGVMGAFSYLAFQSESVVYNLKSITIHGASLIVAFSLGMASNLVPGSMPFGIGVISFVAFILTKVYNIPKPDYFFVIMLYAMGTSFKVVALIKIPEVSGYLVYGLLGSLVAALLVSFVQGLPFRSEGKPRKTLSFSDAYYVTIYRQPEVVLKGLHFAIILFISGYISLLLEGNNGYWVLISSAAVLSGEHMEKIKERSLQRVLGSMVGLLIGAGLLQFHLSLVSTICVLIILNVSVEFFMPKNYTIANFFTNPQVLLLSTLTTNTFSYELIPFRFSGVVIGSLIAVGLMMLMDYSLGLVKEQY